LKVRTFAINHHPEKSVRVDAEHTQQSYAAINNVNSIKPEAKLNDQFMQKYTKWYI
jgi:hypothetical protein